MELNKIINGDCLDVMASLPDESFGLCITSPPYNLRNSTGGGLYSLESSKWKNTPFALAEGYDGHTDDMPEDEYQDWLIARMDQIMRLLKDDGAAYVVFKWRTQAGLIQDRREVWNRYPVRQIIIWHRPGSHNFTGTFFLPNYEVIYLITKPGYRIVKGWDHLGAVWAMPPARGNKHPAPFPESLVARCIGASPDNGPILDPFLGSGTTAIVADRAGRPWLGIEQSPVYCEDARQNLAMSRAQLPLF